MGLYSLPPQAGSEKRVSTPCRSTMQIYDKIQHARHGASLALVSFLFCLGRTNQYYDKARNDS